MRNPFQRGISKGTVAYPPRVRFFRSFRMTDAQWDALMIPIGIAFFSRSSRSNRVWLSIRARRGRWNRCLSLETWDEIEQRKSDIAHDGSDVEGLLVYRVGTAREYYIIPIDECFKLIGIIRLKWKGFSGGMEVWQEIAKVS